MLLSLPNQRQAVGLVRDTADSHSNPAVSDWTLAGSCEGGGAQQAAWRGRAA